MKRSCDDATYEPSTHLLFSYSFRCPRDIARSLPRIGQRSQLFQGCDLAECAKNASAWVESVLESLACTTNESTKRASVLRPRSPLSPHALHVCSATPVTFHNNIVSTVRHWPRIIASIRRRRTNNLVLSTGYLEEVDDHISFVFSYTINHLYHPVVSHT